jgi:hypothetical protein
MKFTVCVLSLRHFCPKEYVCCIALENKNYTLFTHTHIYIYLWILGTASLVHFVASQCLICGGQRVHRVIKVSVISQTHNTSNTKGIINKFVYAHFKIYCCMCECLVTLIICLLRNNNNQADFLFMLEKSYCFH